MLIKIRNMGKIDDIIIDSNKPILVVGPNRQAKSTMINAIRLGVLGGFPDVTQKDIIKYFKHGFVEIDEGKLCIKREIKSSIKSSVSAEGKETTPAMYYKTTNPAIMQALYAQDFLDNKDRKKYFSQLSLIGDKVETPFTELGELAPEDIEIEELEKDFVDKRRLINRTIKEFSDKSVDSIVDVGGNSVDLAKIDAKKIIDEPLNELHNEYQKLVMCTPRPEGLEKPDPIIMDKLAKEIGELSEQLGDKEYSVGSNPDKFENRIKSIDKEIAELGTRVLTKKELDKMKSESSKKIESVIKLNGKCPCLLIDCPVEDCDIKNSKLIEKSNKEAEKIKKLKDEYEEAWLTYEKYQSLKNEKKKMKENLDLTKILLERVKKQKKLKELTDNLEQFDRYKNRPTKSEKEKRLSELNGRIKLGEGLREKYKLYKTYCKNLEERESLEKQSERYSNIIDYIRKDLPNLVTSSALSKITDRLEMVPPYLDGEIIFDDDLNVSIKHGELLIPEKFMSRSERLMVAFFIQDAILRESGCPILLLDDIDALDTKYKTSLLQYIDKHCSNFYKIAIFCSKTDIPKDSLGKLPFENIDMYYMESGVIDKVD